MILRFCSGSVTPASRSRNRSRRIHELERQVEPREPCRAPAPPRSAAAARCPRRCTSADRRCARCSSIAATVESTPPDSPQHDAPVADLLADPRDALVDERRHRPVAAAAADARTRSCAGSRSPRSVCTTSGWNSRPYSPRPASWMAATGALADVATTSNPGGAAATKSPWLAQTFSDGGHVVEQRRAVEDVDHGVPELALRRRLDPAAERVRHQAACRSRCPSVGVPRSRIAGSLVGAPGSETLFGPPERMIPAGRRRAISAGGRRGRQDLGVHRQLAQPSRDQLRVLRAEIEDDNRLMCHGRRDESNDEADASRESRYYKRVPRRDDHDILGCRHWLEPPATPDAGHDAANGPPVPTTRKHLLPRRRPPRRHRPRSAQPGGRNSRWRARSA